MDNIHKACRLGDLKLIKKVLEASPNSLNEIDPKLGWSPLYRCVICGHEQATAFLLAKGADPNVQNQIGESPLHQAADSCSLKVVQWLLEAKANPNLKQNGTNHIDGETALHKACARGEPSIVKALLDFKADPDVQNATFGWTPLHYCAETGNTEIWSMLLAYGASPSILDWHGKMPTALSPRSHPTISNRSTQHSAIYKPSSEPQDDTSPILTESFPPTPASSRSFSSVSGDGKATEITKSRSRKGSPPLVPRLKLAPEKKPFHVSSASSGNKSIVSSNASKSQDLSFSFRENYTKRNALEKWLRRSSLEVLTDVLVDGGYDDLDQLLAQAQRIPIAIEQLQSVGVKRRGHAIRLLAALELELQAPEQHLLKEVSTPPWECCEGPDSAAGINAYPSLQQWLRNLGLDNLYPNFISAGFEDLEPLLTVMKTSYALTEEILETDFAIEKPGHRHRIISKLKEDSTHFDPWSSDMGHVSGRSGLRLEKSDRTPSFLGMLFEAEVKGNSWIFTLFVLSNICLGLTGCGTAAAGYYVTREDNSFQWHNGSFIVFGLVLIVIALVGFCSRRSSAALLFYILASLILLGVQVAFTLAIIATPDYVNIMGTTKADIVRYSLLAACGLIFLCIFIAWCYRRTLNSAKEAFENQDIKGYHPLGPDKEEKDPFGSKLGLDTVFTKK